MSVPLHPANERRANWAESALDIFAMETYGGRTFAGLVSDEESPEMGDDYTCVQDLIGDLLHVAARRGWNTAELLRRVESNFVHEADPDYIGD